MSKPSAQRLAARALARADFLGIKPEALFMIYIGCFAAEHPVLDELCRRSLSRMNRHFLKRAKLMIEATEKLNPEDQHSWLNSSNCRRPDADTEPPQPSGSPAS